MRFVSRLAVWLLCVSLTLAALPLAATATTEGDFTYTIADDGSTVTITQYIGSDTTVTIPETIEGLPVTVIAGSAFKNNSTVTSVSLPASLAIIEADAFQGCTGLKTLDIPASVQTIGSMAFYNCTNLESVTVTPYTYDIGYQAFHNTLWYVNAESGPLYLGRVLYSYIGLCESGSSVTVKPGTAAIAPYAFSGQHHLSAVYLPIGLRAIGSCAFLDCFSLTTVRIPPSVTEMDTGVFLNAGAASVYTTPGSVAYEYISGANIHYTYDETLDYPDGDMNKDKLVNSSDFRILMRILLDETMTYDTERYQSSDAVYDGEINSADIRALMKNSITA